MDIRITLRFGSKKHTEIISALKERRTLADKAMDSRRQTWAENEEKYLAYIPASEEDKLKKLRRDGGKGPQSVTTVIPMSYALLMTWYTYMTTVMLGRTPIHQFEGRTNTGDKGKLSVDTLMDYQTRVGEHLLPYYVWLLDTGKYGMGVVGKYWTDETAYVTELRDVPLTFAGLPVGNGKTKVQEVVKEIPGYEGNKLYNIHPSKALFDPRVPLMEYQRGEFVIVDTGVVSRGDILENEEFFNRDVIKETDKEGRLSDVYRSSQLHLPEEIFDAVEPKDAMSVGSLHPEEYYVRLVPKHWGLGDNDKKEIWVFTLIDQRVIIGARALGNYSQKFPIETQEHEPDGHQLTKRSFLEIVGPLQEFLDWLLNTHRLNVEKAINDTLVVDPSLVYMSDVRDPLPGKLIRARPKAYGQGMLDKAIHQVRVQDITQAHLQTTTLIMQMMQRVSGVTEQVMGMLQSGGRKTAQEIRTSATFGINRLKTEAEFLSASAWQPLAQGMLQDTQQYMQREIMLKLIAQDAGLRAKDLEEFIMVDPQTIRGFYDYVAVDGSLPVDRQAQGGQLLQMLTQMAAVPGLLAQYDMGSAFAWIAELMGAKGLANFKIQLSQDEIIKLQLTEGNIATTGDMANAVGTTAPEAALFPQGGGAPGAESGGRNLGGESQVADAA